MEVEKKYDAIVVGSGPNGLSAAITMQKAGLTTLLIEGADTIGGGTRTKELTLPGFRHDVCSAIHPMAMASPFFKTLSLDDYGLELIHPEILAAHPLDSGESGLLFKDFQKTLQNLGVDKQSYQSLLSGTIRNLDTLTKDTMGPLRFPKDPISLASFGLKALQPASWIANNFKIPHVKALWAGMAAHGIQPLENWTTSAIGIMLMAVGHQYGWPIPKGGSQSIANALERLYKSLGGEIQTGFWFKNIADLPKHKILILDLTPKQLLQIEGLNFTNGYKKQLQRFRQGMGVFKIDWALSEPTPFKDNNLSKAGTIHLGNTYEEIAANERLTSQGKNVDKPFVLFSQPSLFDSTRAPEGKHVAWAYCHVPNGSTEDMTEQIEKQIERFAPGFKDTILAKHTFNPKELELYNPNYIGGDINGGVMDLSQLYTRPTMSLTPYRTSNSQVYICSSSTPPGGGVHGMSGFHAARVALKDHFGVVVSV